MKRRWAFLFGIGCLLCVLAQPGLAELDDATPNTGTLTLEGVFQFGDFYGEQKVPGLVQFFSLESDLVTRISTAMQNNITDINVQDLNIPDDSTGQEAITRAFSTSINSNPSFFNVANQIKYYSQNNMIGFLQIAYVADAQVRTTQFQDALQSMLARAIPPGQAGRMSQTEKALALHDQVALELSYHHAAAEAGGSTVYPDAFNAYGAVVSKSAVCQGYALAYVQLLRQVGINAMVVPSTALNHMWTLVQITDLPSGSGWYHVDCTWDDPAFGSTPDGDRDWSGYVGHSYFIRTDAEEAAENRTWNAEAELPASAAAPHPYNPFWQGVQSGMFFHDGAWVFLEGWGSAYTYRGMVKTSPYGVSRAAVDIVPAGSYATLPVRIADRLYYYKFADAASYAGDLYYYDLVNQEEQLLHTIQEDRFAAELYAQNDALAYTELYSANRQPAGSGTLALTYTGAVSYGDINEDGRISITDALLILNHKQNRIAFTAKQQKAADINGDGSISAVDAQLIVDYLAGKYSVLPVGG